MSIRKQYRSKWAKMPLEQKRLAVAEFAGWEWCLEGTYAGVATYQWRSPDNIFCGMLSRMHSDKLFCAFRDSDDGDEVLPNYLYSLDAIAGAVAELGDSEYQDYLAVLHCVVQAGYRNWFEATAEQRCEAYWVVMTEGCK